MQTTLDLPAPPSVNRLRKLNKAALRRYEAWQIAADRFVTKQWAEAKLRGSSRPSFGGDPVVVTIQLSEKLRHDADNTGKALLDYLKRIEVIRDDSKQFVRRIVIEWVEPGNAPIGVRITVARDDRFRLKY